MQKPGQTMLLMALLCSGSVSAAQTPPAASAVKPEASAPATAAQSRAAAAQDEALPAGVRFSVWATPWYLTGGVDSGSDQFRFQLEGDETEMRKISRIDYALDSVGTGDPRRNFFLDGAVERSRWPVSATITWRNGKITQVKLARP